MAKKPQPAKSTVEVNGIAFQAIELDKDKSYVVALNRQKVTMQDARGFIEALIAQGHTDVTVFMVDGEPAESVKFYQEPDGSYELAGNDQ